MGDGCMFGDGSVHFSSFLINSHGRRWPRMQKPGINYWMKWCPGGVETAELFIFLVGHEGKVEESR